MWAIGCILYEMAMLDIAFFSFAKSPQEQRKEIKKKIMMRKYDKDIGKGATKVSREIKELIETLMTVD